MSLVLRRMGHEDVAMEYYVAENKRPVEKCLQDVKASDLYVGIFAWRYGWIPKRENRKKLSITELEYREAVKSGKDRLIFLVDGKALWSADLIDDNKTRIKKLRAQLSEDRLTMYFKSPDELGGLVAQAIHEWDKAHGYLPSGFSPLRFDLTAYYEAVRKRYQRLDLDALTPPEKEEDLQLQLCSVFVEQSVRENILALEPREEGREKLQQAEEIRSDDSQETLSAEHIQHVWEAPYERPLQPVLDILTDIRYPHTVILGDLGSGKSTLCRYVLLSLVDPANNIKVSPALNSHLPLLVELRSYASLRADRKCDTFLEFFEYLGKTEGWHLTQAALHGHLNNDGRAVVIFDGLDEILAEEDRERVAHQIVGFAISYPKVRIIVTSRPIGYRRKILSDANFRHFTLQELDGRQVVEFVDRWYGIALSDRPDEARERRDRIIRSVMESRSVRQLARNPMLLTILAIIGRHQEIPRERWKLYEHAASVLTHHWDINKHLKNNHVELDFIGEDDKKTLLRRLAYKMQAEESKLARSHLRHEELQEEFERYIIERYDQTPARAKVAAEVMIRQFRERNFILSFHGADLYGFVHRAFLEYFCATAFVYRFEKTRETTIDELKQDVYGTHWADQNWHEVLRLICEMIDEKFAGEIIDYLGSGVNQPLPEDSGDRSLWNITLAIQCLAEVNNINALVGPAGRLLKVICSLLEIKRGIKFIQDQLPSIHLIGRIWPQRRTLAHWLMEWRPKNLGWHGSMPLGEFIGAVGGGYEEVRRALDYYSEQADKSYRVIVPFALGEGWRDDSTMMLLRDWAVNDSDWNVRCAAIMALGQHFVSNSQTFALLRDRAMNDVSKYVRWPSMVALIAAFQSSPETLSIIKDRAVHDDEELVRSNAVTLLHNVFATDWEVVSILCERTANDSVSSVRFGALCGMIDSFERRPETLSLLCDRAVNESEESLRLFAITSLIKHFPSNRQAMSVVRDRLESDSSAHVRSRIEELIKKSSKH